ncbi:MAG TPA: hypothetical protein VNH18_14710 [Bryobacteraceae bacterium]|nr:hypothetical protein [Blastocatellia bacterium]HXJ40530.1 hypothetical protein [Bryobacteraceae bacterium]
MIDPSEVSAVIVTKGDNESTLARIRESLSMFAEVLVWDNSQSINRKVYGRYVAALNAFSEYIYTQDDDCLVDARKLFGMYQPGELLCNMLPSHQPFYAATGGISLVGWGAIFPKALIDFSAYLANYPEDELFDRECDRIFTWLNRSRTRIVDIGVGHLPHAHGADRMGMESRHGNDLAEIRHRLAVIYELYGIPRLTAV